MKVTITHMKAPWPAGAAVGDVVEVGDALPGCFVGKCTPADAKAKATHVYPEKGADAPADQTADLRAKLKAAEAALADMEAGALKAADEHAAALAAMTQRAEAAEAALAKVAPPKK